MKKTFLALAFLTSLMVAAQSTWKSDGAHSKVGFGITHLMISEIEGHFSDFDITATATDTFDEAEFTVDIKTTSIDTDNERRDDHLRSADFFDAERYPSITFKSTNFEKTGDNTFKLTGDLSMHGVTKPVSLEGKVNGIITDQRSQKLKAGLKLTGTVNRLEFGVGDDTPTLGDEVKITINLEMAQQ
ncbi:YceI family protein [Flagellimonas halotolerans]|uniref:YceI family protein n=1 Tax=Flagellimonas halotolerans TaxID=3112164 RepID=A0ABU6ILW5_9FLAO|nr:MULTISPECIES: YceI family protein [unclassified Allomuricauda]MEC3964198.1 YceI family protein [Muricauda sp. SYSU M86414]MEC4264068.1 YceI family protein [Muricauda sp. SYSU M84420]